MFDRARLELRVTGDRFTEWRLDDGKWRKVGYGTLRGPRWRWTSWTLVSTAWDDEATQTSVLTKHGLHRESGRNDGETAGGMIDELTEFDCKSFDDRVAAWK